MHSTLHDTLKVGSTSHGKLLAGHSPTTLQLASAGSVCLRSTTSCSTRLEPASTKGQNFFPTVITNPLFFFQNKNLHDTKLGASSKFQNKKFFHNIYHNSNLHSKFTQQHIQYSSHSTTFHTTTLFHSSNLYSI